MAPQCCMNKNDALASHLCTSCPAKLSDNMLSPNLHALASLPLLTRSLHLDTLILP